MEIRISNDNYKNLAQKIKKNNKVNRKIIISWDNNNIPKFKETIFFLQEVVDSLIFKDIPFEIRNVPYCLMLGYKRYIKFDKSKFKKANGCMRCNYGEDCRGVFSKYFTLYGLEEIKPIGINTYLTDLEKCMLKVLETENNIPTERVLKIAKRFRICAGCSDGSHVLSTGEKLIKKNMVKKVYKKGRYFWSLV